MTDLEMVREYNTAKDKKEQIKILSELTLRPKEEIIRILKENGCEVEEKRRGRKPKAEDQSNADKSAGSPRKRRSSSAVKEAKSSNSAGETESSSSAEETESSSSTGETKSSSGIPEGVRIALKKEAEYASYMIKAYREEIEKCCKTIKDIFEFADEVGISEKDLMR